MGANTDLEAWPEPIAGFAPLGLIATRSMSGAIAARVLEGNAPAHRALRQAATSSRTAR